MSKTYIPVALRKQVVPLTAKGRVTIRLLQLNRRDRVEERQLLLEAGMLDPSLP